MRSSPTVCAWAVAAASAMHGCGAQVFICADASECPGGTCEPSGFCSFPDDACASGQRYGAHAPASVANACVDPLAGTSGTGEGDATSSPATTLTTSLDASSAEVGSIDEASTTPLSDTGDDTSTTTTMPATSSESGMAPDVPIELPPCTVETFDDDVLDEFEWWGELVPVVAEGTLSVTLATMPTTGGLGFPNGGFVEREAKVVVVGVPNQAEATQVALAVGDGTTTMLILHEQDMLIVRHDDSVTLDNRISVTPVVPATWRIRAHDDTLFFERDVGNGWEMLWSEVPDFDLAQSGAFFYVNTWLDAMMPGTAQIDEISECPYGGG